MLGLIVAHILLACVALPAEAQGETTYLALLINDHKVGYAKHIRHSTPEKVTTTEQVNLSVGRAGQNVDIHITTTAFESPAGKGLGFQFLQNMSFMSVEASGTIDKNNKLVAHITTAGVTQTRTIKLPPDAMMAEGARLDALKRGLKTGDVFTQTLFIPEFMATITAEHHIGKTGKIDLLGRVVTLTKVKTILSTPQGTLEQVAYVDKELMPQKLRVNMGGMNVEMIACTEQYALSKNDPMDLFEKMVIKSPGSLSNVQSAKSATYHLKPLGNGPLPLLPSTDNQSVVADGQGGQIVTVTPLKMPEKAVTFPYTGTCKDALDAMAPTMYLQSDNPVIIALAREAIGATRDTAEAVKRIEAFVGKYITEKSLAVGYATATEVAVSKEGDCSEHAVLTAAMCRAVGIPARMVVGIVYVSKWLQYKDIFGGHAWAQAYVGDRWICLDATGVANGYGAGHIIEATGDGNPVDFFNVVHTLDNIKIVSAKLHE